MYHTVAESQFTETGHKPEEDDRTVKDSGKVERGVGVAFRRGTFTEVAHDTEILLLHLERIRSSGS